MAPDHRAAGGLAQGPVSHGIPGGPTGEFHGVPTCLPKLLAGTLFEPIISDMPKDILKLRVTLDNASERMG